MAMRPLLLWFILLFLVIRGWSFVDLSAKTTYWPSYMFIARRALTSKSNRHHPHHHHHHHAHHLKHSSQAGLVVVRASPSPVDDGNEIDPRYGIEKRLVPTGPNPLHH